MPELEGDVLGRSERVLQLVPRVVEDAFEGALGHDDGIDDRAQRRLRLEEDHARVDAEHGRRGGAAVGRGGHRIHGTHGLGRDPQAGQIEERHAPLAAGAEGVHHLCTPRGEDLSNRFHRLPGALSQFRQ